MGLDDDDDDDDHDDDDDDDVMRSDVITCHLTCPPAVFFMFF